MRKDLKRQAENFNKNYKELVKFLAKKDMFISTISSDFKTFSIFKGKYPYHEYVGKVDSKCEINSIMWV